MIVSLKTMSVFGSRQPKKPRRETYRMQSRMSLNELGADRRTCKPARIHPPPVMASKNMHPFQSGRIGLLLASDSSAAHISHFGIDTKSSLRGPLYILV